MLNLKKKMIRATNPFTGELYSKPTDNQRELIDNVINGKSTLTFGLRQTGKTIAHTNAVGDYIKLVNKLKIDTKIILIFDRMQLAHFFMDNLRNLYSELEFTGSKRLLKTRYCEIEIFTSSACVRAFSQKSFSRAFYIGFYDEIKLHEAIQNFQFYISHKTPKFVDFLGFYEGRIDLDGPEFCIGFDSKDRDQIRKRNESIRKK